MKPPRRRLATHDDLQLLQSFQCARRVRHPERDAEPWATQVQGWIRNDALREQRKMRPKDLRVLLFEDPDSGALVGVSAHVRTQDAPPAIQRLLIVVAVDLDHRGSILTTGQTLGSAVVSSTLLDVADSDDGPVDVFGLVTEGNLRSRGLLRRLGFREMDSETGESMNMLAVVLNLR